MTQTISDFNKNELWIINTTLEERYGEKVDIEFADTDMRLNPHSTELTPCPTVFWSRGSDDASFVIVKVSELPRYRTQFFYRVHQQYGTGVEEYDDLTDCVVSILQVQADLMAKMAEEAEKAEAAGAKKVVPISD